MDTKQRNLWEDIIRNVFAKAKEDKEYADRKITADWIIALIKGKVIPLELEAFSKMLLIPAVERIQVMMRKMSVTEVTMEDKVAIGDLIKKAWFESPFNLYIRHVKINEPTGTFTVNAYPQRFVPVMDAIIRVYFNNKSDQLKESSLITIGPVKRDD